MMRMIRIIYNYKILLNNKIFLEKYILITIISTINTVMKE